MAQFVIQARDAVAVGDLGMDFAFYRDAGSRWLETGSFYLPHQLAGPYQLALMIDVLYPPTALLLFVPFAVLPDFAAVALWWGIPLALLAYSVLAWRPSAPWLLAFVVLLLWPRAVGAVVFGNTDIWVSAAVAAGLRWGWPAAGLTLKPVFAPFMLLFVRSRAFWLAIVALSLVSLAMIPLWRDYATATMNSENLSLLYSLGSLPLVMAPVLLWMGKRSTGRPPEATIVAQDPAAATG